MQEINDGELCSEGSYGSSVLPAQFLRDSEYILENKIFIEKIPVYGGT